MSCNCNNNCHDTFCPQYLQAVTTPCDEPGCDQQLTTDCVIYTGPDLPCLGITTGMQLTEILLSILYELHPECQGITTTTTTNIITTTTTAAPLPLKLVLVDPLTQSVADPANVDDWNDFFKLPSYGNPFTSAVVISEYEVWLYGASLILLTYDPFGDQYNIVSIIDDAGCIIALLDNCFEYNDELTTVSLPACRLSVGGSFDDCTALTSLNIPNLVAAEGDYTFNGVAVTSFNLPLLETVGSNCFNDCINVTTFNLPSLANVGTYLFSGCSSMTSYNLPLLNWGTATTLPDGTFAGCSSMTSFNFPNLQTVSSHLFRDCSSAIINTPNVTQIGSYSFQGCTAMTSFSFPLVTSIGEYAFWWCTSATSFNFPLCTNLGGTIIDDGVFLAISTNTITLTIPIALMTCLFGNPDGDIQYLQGNNTVTIVTV